MAHEVELSDTVIIAKSKVNIFLKKEQVGYKRRENVSRPFIPQKWFYFDAGKSVRVITLPFTQIRSPIQCFECQGWKHRRAMSF